MRSRVLRDGGVGRCGGVRVVAYNLFSIGPKPECNLPRWRSMAPATILGPQRRTVGGRSPLAAGPQGGGEADVQQELVGLITFPPSRLPT